MKLEIMGGRIFIFYLRIVRKLGIEVEYIHDGGPWYRGLNGLSKHNMKPLRM